MLYLVMVSNITSQYKRPIELRSREIPIILDTSFSKGLVKSGFYRRRQWSHCGPRVILIKGLGIEFRNLGQALLQAALSTSHVVGG
ncbi:hypothetical protein ASE05_13065 [Mesorhizobium sp. Root172]|nr:hypothetical protein ASE05_13065 [Mesorhizobium sp. Root172]